MEARANYNTRATTSSGVAALTNYRAKLPKPPPYGRNGRNNILFSKKTKRENKEKFEYILFNVESKNK